MRKFNVILVLIIMFLLLDHAFFGNLHMLGFDVSVFGPFALVMVGLVLLHTIISMLVTIRAEKAGMKTHARYQKENQEFWLRRSSGMGILVFALIHAYSMLPSKQGPPNIAFMPKIFELATPLMILCIALHIYVNIKPLLIAVGNKHYKTWEKVLKGIVIVFFAIAFIVTVRFILSMMGGQ